MFRTKWRFLYVFLLGSYSFLNIKFTEGDSVLSLPISNTAFYFIILFIVLAVWEGNNLLSSVLRKKPSRRVSIALIQQFTASLILVSILVPVVSIGINASIGSASLLTGFNQVLGFSFRINLFLQCINAIIVYNNALSSTRLEAETLKKETTEAQYEALRKQINPHFLFNSFNVLSSIIESDSKLAVHFVEQLSNVYRYLLKTQEMKVVPLKEELAFIDSYIFLLKIRFGENLQISKDILGENRSLPPSTLQLLIENAIKHNEVSKANPLKVSLYRDNGTLIVSNNKNAKSNDEESSGVGLSNITKRYQLLGGEAPEIHDEEDRFLVKIPLL